MRLLARPPHPPGALVAALAGRGARVVGPRQAAACPCAAASVAAPETLEASRQGAPRAQRWASRGSPGRAKPVSPARSGASCGPARAGQSARASAKLGRAGAPRQSAGVGGGPHSVSPLRRERLGQAVAPAMREQVRRLAVYPAITREIAPPAWCSDDVTTPERYCGPSGAFSASSQSQPVCCG